MWCINLSNLATGILWFLAIASFGGVICLIFAVRCTETMHEMYRKRVQANEHDIGNLKVDVEWRAPKEKEVKK